MKPDEYFAPAKSPCHSVRKGKGVGAGERVKGSKGRGVKEGEGGKGRD
jgi:hypothetical protein